MKGLLNSLRSFEQRCMVRMAATSIQGPDDNNVVTYGMLKIVAQAEERARIVDACDWLAGTSPTTLDLIRKHLTSVIVIKDGVNTVLPTQGTVLVTAPWVVSATRHNLVQLLATASRHVCECEVNGLWKKLMFR